MSRIVDTVESIDLARWNTQQKGPDPSLAFTFDPEVMMPGKTDLVRLRAQLEAVASGPNNAGKMFFVPVGTSVTKLSNTPAEMAWESGWEQLMNFELAAYGVPKGVAGMEDDTSYAGLFARLKQFNIGSLIPHLGKISGRFNKRVIAPCFGRELYMTLTPERIDDKELAIREADILMRGGVLKKNELRLMFDMPPLEGPEGEEFVEAGAQKPEDVINQNGEKPQGKLDKLGPERRREEEEITNSRPRNNAGKNALGPRKSMMPPERLAAILDNAKVNGHVTAVDDEGMEFLKKR